MHGGREEIEIRFRAGYDQKHVIFEDKYVPFTNIDTIEITGRKDSEKASHLIPAKNSPKSELMGFKIKKIILKNFVEA